MSTTRRGSSGSTDSLHDFRQASPLPSTPPHNGYERMQLSSDQKGDHKRFFSFLKAQYRFVTERHFLYSLHSLMFWNAEINCLAHECTVFCDV